MGVPVSVVMTVRNGQPYLPEAVASILAQTYRDFEFLLVDNGSTDGSVQVMRGFDDPRMRIVELGRDIGRIAALNMALREARGDYVAIQDADDISLPTRLEKQMSYLSGRPDVVLLGTWPDVIDEKGDLCGEYRLPTDRQGILDHFVVDNAFAHSSVVFRAAPVRELGGYPEDYPASHDAMLWLAVSSRYEVANLPEVLVHIRRHADRAGLSPDIVKAAKWDRLRLYREAQFHGVGTAHARKSGRRAMAHAMVDYAETLSQERRRRQALRWATEAVIRYPLLCVRDVHIRARAIRVFAGPRLSGLLSNVKRRLFRASATRRLSNGGGQLKSERHDRRYGHPADCACAVCGMPSPAMFWLRKLVFRALRAYWRTPFRGRTRLTEFLHPRLCSPGVPFDVRVSIDGVPFTLDLGDGLQSRMYYGNYEPGFVAFVRRVLQRGQVFVDAGANVGYYSAIAASKVGSSGEVHSFEPVPWLYARLERLSVEAAKVGFRISPNESALGDAGGQTTIYVMDTDNIGWSTTSYDMIRDPNTIAEALPCRSLSLDEYFIDQRLRRPDMVKMDVEGGEIGVLKGMRRLFEAGQRPVLICEAHRRKVDEITGWLTQFGYKPFQCLNRGDLISVDPPLSQNAESLIRFNVDTFVFMPQEKQDAA